MESIIMSRAILMLIFCNILQSCSTLQDTNSSSVPSTLTVTPLAVTATAPNVSWTQCRLELRDQRFLMVLKMVDTRSKMVEFTVKIRNLTTGDEFVDSIGNYRPYLWFRVNNEHGKTLLLFSFNYDILSLTMLKIGVPAFDLHLVDYPEMCFAELSDKDRVRLLRKFFLLNMRTSDDFWFIQNQMVCNMEFQRSGTIATAEYNCCQRNKEGTIECNKTLSDGWINVLYLGLEIVKWLIILCCPLLIPDGLYRVRFMVSEYIVKLKDNKLPLTMFVSEQDDVSFKYRKRVTKSDISSWTRFRRILDELPRDEPLDMHIPELHIRVKTKNLLPENEAPSGLFRTIYDNIVRCRLRNLDAFADCCDERVDKACNVNVERPTEVTWYICLRKFVRVCILFFILPIPFYIRVVVYYYFEKKELDNRGNALRSFDSSLSLTFFHGSPMQYMTPTHPVFIIMYVVYSVASLTLAFDRSRVRTRIKNVFQGSLRDMVNKSSGPCVTMAVRLFLWPFRECGLLGFLIVPVFWTILLPFTLLLFVLYCIPTVYMSFRLLTYSAGSTDRMVGSKKEQPLDERIVKLKGEIINRFQTWRNKSSNQARPPTSISTLSYFVLPRRRSRLQYVRGMVMQLTVGICAVAFMYGMILLVAESILFFIEVACFTLMGIIVNASATIRYLTLIFLIIIYSNDCYSNVHKNYLDFNKSIMEDIMRRVDDLQKIACMPSSVQENLGFVVKPVDEDQKIEPMLNFDKRKPRWGIGHLLLFLDSFDTPRIPIRLFEQLCQVRVSGAPGPVYLNHFRATKKFLNILLFLVFVMIVVKAFGEVYQVSSTKQMMATLAGGFIPMLFRKVWSSNARNMSLNTISFKGQVDEIINGFEQEWPMTDLCVEPVPPEPDESPEDENVTVSITTPQSNNSVPSPPVDVPHKKERRNTVFVSRNESETRFIVENNHLSVVKERDDYPSKDNIADGTGIVDLFVDLSSSEDEPWWIHRSEEYLPSIPVPTIVIQE